MRASSAMLNQSAAGFSLRPTGSVLGASQELPVDNLLSKGGSGPLVKDYSAQLSSPMTNTSRYNRGPPIKKNTSISDEVLQMMRNVPSKISATVESDEKQEPSVYSTDRFSEYLAREARRSPEERKVLERIRQPLSPMINYMVLQRERELKHESKPVQLKEPEPFDYAPGQGTEFKGQGTEFKGHGAEARVPVANASALSRLSKGVETMYVGTAVTNSTRTWGDIVYMFEFEHPSLAKDFAFTQAYAQAHSIDNSEANVLVEVQLPSVLVSHGSVQIPWVRVINRISETGELVKSWCPVHDGRGNYFLKDMQKMTDYVAQLVDYTKEEMQPLVDRVEQIFEMISQK